jgi:2-iminobutanoate/2-iminopropanoate deaminase
MFHSTFPTGNSMTKIAISCSQLAPPAGPYSIAVQAGGFLFRSGQVGLDPVSRKLVEGGVRAEVSRILLNFQTALGAMGKSLSDVVRVGVYLTSMNDFAAMNDIYTEYFAEPYPARTTVAVTALPLGALAEIDMLVL